jgi:hypothetical protein
MDATRLDVTRFHKKMDRGASRGIETIPFWELTLVTTPVINIVRCNKQIRSCDGEANCNSVDYNSSVDSILAMDGLGFGWK